MSKANSILPAMDLSIRFFWQEVDPDYSMCKICDEMLTTKMYQATVDVAGTEVKINYKICEECKFIMDEQDKIKYG